MRQDPALNREHHLDYERMTADPGILIDREAIHSIAEVIAEGWAIIHHCPEKSTTDADW